MAKLRRSERIAIMVKVLTDHPGKTFPLKRFAERFDAAKSTISEDLSIIKETLEGAEMGTIQTFPGATGGVCFLPRATRETMRETAQALCDALSDRERLLPGGFLYMRDIVFSPVWARRFGHVFASRYGKEDPEYVVTVETGGVPVALMTAYFLNRPLVVLRRNTLVTEGSSVSINYLTDSSNQIQTMSLPRRALPQGARVLLVDDFMRGGGTARGMVDLMFEVDGDICGIAVLVVTGSPAKKRVDAYTPMCILEEVDVDQRRVTVRLPEWLDGDGAAT